MLRTTCLLQLSAFSWAECVCLRLTHLEWGERGWGGRGWLAGAEDERANMWPCVSCNRSARRGRDLGRGHLVGELLGGGRKLQEIKASKGVIINASPRPSCPLHSVTAAPPRPATPRHAPPHPRPGPERAGPHQQSDNFPTNLVRNSAHGAGRRGVGRGGAERGGAGRSRAARPDIHTESGGGSGSSCRGESIEDFVHLVITFSLSGLKGYSPTLFSGPPPHPSRATK